MDRFTKAAKNPNRYSFSKLFFNKIQIFLWENSRIHGNDKINCMTFIYKSHMTFADLYVRIDPDVKKKYEV